MNKLIVQVCAVLLFTGMVAQELNALSIDRPGVLQGNGIAEQGWPAVPFSGCQESGVLRLPDVEGISPRGLTAPQPEGRTNDGGFRQKAAGELFGADAPGPGPLACSLDPVTLCLTLGSRVYPIIPVDHDTFLGGVMSRLNEADTPMPLQGSLILTGLGLMAVSGLWKRKVTASDDRKKTPLPLPPTLNTHVPGKGREAKAHSLAA